MKRVIIGSITGVFRQTIYPTLTDVLVALVVAGVPLYYAGLTRNMVFSAVAFVVTLVFVVYMRKIIQVFMSLHRLKKNSDRLMDSTKNILDGIKK